MNPFEIVVEHVSQDMQKEWNEIKHTFRPKENLISLVMKGFGSILDSYTHIFENKLNYQ